MQLYQGTRKLYAESMTLGLYNKYRGWQIPAEEDPQAKGYLVEYVDGGDKNDGRHEGYITWTPKAVFDMLFKPV